MLNYQRVTTVSHIYKWVIPWWSTTYRTKKETNWVPTEDFCDRHGTRPAEANLSFHLPDKPKSKWFCKLLAMSLRYLVSAGGIGKPISTIGAQHCRAKLPNPGGKGSSARQVHMGWHEGNWWKAKARRNCWIWDGVAAGAWFRLTRFRISASPAWKAEVHQGFDTFPYDVPTIRTGYSPEVGATAG